MTYVNNADNTCVVSGISDPTETCIDIPDKAPNGNTVIGIQAYAFRSNTVITSLSAPESVTFVGERAFNGCNKLQTAYLPGVTSISTYAFESCSSLQSIIYSDFLTSIEEKTFNACSALKECRAVSSSNNLDTITAFGYCAFAQSGITNPTFSKNLTSTSLANQPFRYCHSLGRVDLSAATLDTLGGGFAQTSFTEFIFPKGITEISRSCFASCSFQSMTIPDSVDTIQYDAFYNAYFTKVTLGNGLETIGSSAFENTSGDIDFSRSVRLKTVAYRAFAKSRASSIILPGSITSIGNEAFAECTNLQVLGIPFISTSPQSSIYSTNCFGAIFSANATNANQKKYIPSSLQVVIITAQSAELEFGDFTNVTLSGLVLPKNFTCKTDSLNFRLTSLFYLGSPEDLPDISQAMNSQYQKTTVYYYSETQPESTGQYWHYVDGKPTLW